jgi:hypothetical protein
MAPIRLRDIDYLSLAESFTMTGFSVHQTFEQDPEIYGFEFSDLSQDIHVWLFPFERRGRGPAWFDGRSRFGRRIIRSRTKPVRGSLPGVFDAVRDFKAVCLLLRRLTIQALGILEILRK